MTKKKTTRVLVIGANGQLGQSFRWLESRARGQGITLLFAGHQQLDICNVDNIAAVLDAMAPDTVINAAAYTAVDKAEEHADQAGQINAVAGGLLAQACRQRGVWLAHISTDYVFDGRKPEPYREQDAVNPMGVYGKTKLAGERAVLDAMPEALVLRTSWVFSQFGNNFLKTMLRLAGQHRELKVVADQFGGPTYAPHIAGLLLRLVDSRFANGHAYGGIYHFSGVPYVSWYEFATDIFLQAVAQKVLESAPVVHPIGSVEYPTRARRPENSRLCNDKVNGLLDGIERDWQQGVRLALAESGLGAR